MSVPLIQNMLVKKTHNYDYKPNFYNLAGNIALKS